MRAWRVLLAVLAASLFLVPSARAQKPTAIVSLGDSYISGEAGRWAGNSNDSAGDRDGTDRAYFNGTYDPSRVYGASAANGCHRSDVAEVRSSTTGLSARLNIACSGAVTRNIFRASNGGEPEKGEPPQADQLQLLARQYRIRLIVLSIGGNDLGFASIVQDCLVAFETSQPPCHDSEQA